MFWGENLLPNVYINSKESEGEGEREKGVQKRREDGKYFKSFLIYTYNHKSGKVLISSKIY